MTENKNRCVITGLGMISAVGENTADCWKSAVEASIPKTAMPTMPRKCLTNISPILPTIKNSTVPHASA